MGEGGKALYKSMKNAMYGKTVANLRNKIDVRLVRNKKDILKWTSTPSYMSQKKLDNDLVTKYKSEVTLMFNKPAYAGCVC